MMIQLKGLHKTYKGAQPLHVLKGIVKASTPWGARSSKTSAKPKLPAIATA